MDLLSLAIWAIAGIIVLILVKSWITVYNKFVYWKTKAERSFADIDVIIQQRLDMISALAQVVKKYDIHEYKTLTDVIEARSGWRKNTDLNSKVKAAQKIENNFIKIQALMERYPKLKAEALHRTLMGRGNISKIESRLSRARSNYNRVAEMYNQRVRRFPRKIVAGVHGFKELPYLNFENQEPYKPKEIFAD